MNAVLHPHPLPREIEAISTREDGPAWHDAQARGWALLGDLPLGADLGEGSYARARALTAPEGWVIKLTTDVTEARTWCFVRRYRATRTHSGLAALPTVPGVWLLPGEPPLFAVLQAHCTPLTGHAREAVTALLARWGEWLCQEELPVEPPPTYGEEGSRYNALRLYRTIRTLRGQGFRWREPNPANIMRDEDGYWCLPDLGGFTSSPEAFVPLELPLYAPEAIKDTLTALPSRRVLALTEALPSADTAPLIPLPPEIATLASISAEDGWVLATHPTARVRVITPAEARTWARVHQEQGEQDPALLRVRYVAALAPTRALLVHDETVREPPACVTRAIHGYGPRFTARDSFLRALDKDQREQGERFLTTVAWLHTLGIAPTTFPIRLDWAGEWRLLTLPPSEAPTTPLPPFDPGALEAAFAPPAAAPYVAPVHDEDAIIAGVVAALQHYAPSAACKDALTLPPVRVRVQQLLRTCRFPRALPTPAPWTVSAPPGSLCRWVYEGSSIELASDAEGAFIVTIYDDTRRTRQDDPTRSVFSSVTPESAERIIGTTLSTIAARTRP